MLIETAVIFLLLIALLVCVVQGYGSCLRTQERSREAWQAFLLAEQFAAGQEVNLPPPWQITKQVSTVQDMVIFEVQVQKNNIILANVIQIL